MLPYALIIAAVLILAVALRFAEGDDPGNGMVHHQENEPRGDDEPDLEAAAA